MQKRKVPSSPAALLLLLVLTAAPAYAQPAALQEGRRSIEFTVPDGESLRFGLWRFFSERTSVGIIFGVGYSHAEFDTGATESLTTLALTAGPALKRYFRGSARVSPFTRFDLGLTHQREDRLLASGAEIETRTAAFSFGGGLGVDWFPVDQVSVGGYTGARLEWRDSEPGGTLFTFTTFVSRLLFNIYF